MMVRDKKTLAALSVAVAAVACLYTTGFAQNAPPNQPNFDNLEVRSLHVQGNVWMLTAGPFNAAVSIGPDGVLVVDTLVAPLADKMIAEIKRIGGGKPIRYLLNTHFHPDHTGGNAKVAAAGASIVAGNFAAQVGTEAANAATVISHEKTLMRMLDLQPPIPTVGIPLSTFFTERKDMFFNGEAVQLLYQPNAHTDGDAIVYFRRSDVIVAGDVYINTTFPIFRTDQGGSYQGVIDALNNIIELAVPADKEEAGTYVIPGHGRLGDEYDVLVYRDMNTVIRNRFQDAIKRGLTLDQVKAERLVRDYEGRYGAAQGFWTTDNFIEAVYKNLAASVKPAAEPQAPKARGQKR